MDKNYHNYSITVSNNNLDKWELMQEILKTIEHLIIKKKAICDNDGYIPKTQTVYVETVRRLSIMEKKELEKMKFHCEIKTEKGCKRMLLHCIKDRTSYQNFDIAEEVEKRLDRRRTKEKIQPNDLEGMDPNLIPKIMELEKFKLKKRKLNKDNESNTVIFKDGMLQIDLNKYFQKKESKTIFS